MTRDRRGVQWRTHSEQSVVLAAMSFLPNQCVRVANLLAATNRVAGTGCGMRWRRRFARFWLVVLVAILTESGNLPRIVVNPQEPSGAPEYTMLLTAERALSFVAAADRKLPYVPGEV